MLQCLTCGASSVSTSDGCSELCRFMPPGNLGRLCFCWGEAAYMKSLPGSLDRLFWMGVPCTARPKPVGCSALLHSHLSMALLPLDP